MAGNGWIWLEWLDIAGNFLKWLELLEWFEIAGNS